MSIKMWYIIQTLLSFTAIVYADNFTYVKIPTCERECRLLPDKILTCEQCNCTTFPASMVNIYDVYLAESIFYDNNQVTNITQVGKFYNLRRLELDNNHISYIEDKAFNTLYYLSRLNLAKNYLKVVKEEHFTGLTSLIELDLSENKLARVDSNVFYHDLRALTTLRLGGNVITEVDHNAFTDLPRLQYLHLDSNLIKVIHANHFLGLGRLEELVLKNNKIFHIPTKCFYECENLKTVDFRSNWINNVSTGAFAMLESLDVLHLSNNKLPSITKDMFTGLPNLKSIYLNDNPIAYIEPGSLPDSLLKISLSNSQYLTSIGNKTFTNLRRLSTVDMTGNKKLTVIEAEAFQDNSTVGSTAVQDLNLFNNSLVILPQSLLNWTKVDSPVLGNNDWICDCNLAWVTMGEVFSTEIKQQIVCSYPHHLKGKAVTEVDFMQFSCSFFSKHQYGLEIAMITFITILFVMISGFLLKHCRYSLFPCCFITPGKYSTMYNAVQTDEEDRVNIKWGSKSSIQATSQRGTYQTGEKEKIVPGPTSV